MADSDITPAPGILLVAPPMMLDPNFRRTVVLLCEHNAEGTFGLILNRPLSLELSELLDDVMSSEAVSLGGPVQQNTLHFLHRHGDIMADSIPVIDGVHWGGDFEVIKTMIETNYASPHDRRFFLGYAGWSPGQLEEEIEHGGWFLTHADAELIFDAAPERLWSIVLRRMGGDYALLSNFPEDPRLN